MILYNVVLLNNETFPPPPQQYMFLLHNEEESEQWISSIKKLIPKGMNSLIESCDSHVISCDFCYSEQCVSDLL